MFAALGFVMGLIPRWGYVLGAGALFATVWGYHAITVHRAKADGRAEIQAKWDAERAAAQAMQSEIERMARRANQGVTDAHQAEKTRLAAAGAVADDRVRDLTAELAAARDSAASAGTDGAAAVALELLGECAARRRGVAGEAARLAAQVGALQDYATRVCVAAPP